MALTDGLIASYSFEGNANNGVSNNYNGSASNITYSTGNGVVDEGAGFNGSNSGIGISNIPFGNAGSIVMWYKTSVTTNSQYMMDSSGSRYLIYDQGNGYIGWFLNNNVITQTEVPLTQNTWTHLVCTWNGSSQSMYMNGSLVGTWTVSAGTSTPSTTYLGHRFNSVEYLSGALDEVLFYNRAITSTEVAKLYNGGTGVAYPFGNTLANRLSAYYKLDGDSTDAIAGNNGTDTNMTYSTSDGLINEGAATTSSTGGIAIPASTLGTIGTGDFAVSFWLNPAAPASGKYPMVFGSFQNNSGNGYPGPTIFYDPGDQLGLGNALIFRLKNSNQKTITSPSASSLEGSWHHIVFMRSSGTCYVYLDNVQKLSFSDTTNIPAADLAYIFSRPADPQYQPTGAKGDEFGLWTRALTSTEIGTLYNSGAGNQYPFSAAYTQTLSEAAALSSSLLRTASRSLSDSVAGTASVVKTAARKLLETTELTSSFTEGMLVDTGAVSPGTGTNDDSAGDVAWDNPGNITSSDAAYATAILNGQTSQYLRASDFGFEIPTGSTIVGIKVEIEKAADGTITDDEVLIVKSDGTYGATNKASGDAWPDTEAYTAYGGENDLWGETWEAEDINDTDFGVVLRATD